MKRGFTCSWRKELASSVWLMPPMYHRVFYWLRQKAKWRPEIVPTNKGIGIWLDPGMLITSYQIIGEGVAYSDMGVLRVPSKKTVSRVLAWLQRNDQIQAVAGHYGTTIRILNWDKYQPAGNELTQYNKKSNTGSSRRNRQKADPYAHLYIEGVNKV